jgi:hypothetical protein
MNKLPIVLVLREAYDFLLARYSTFRLLALPGIVILAIADTALAALSTSLWEGLGQPADPPTPEQVEAANSIAGLTVFYWLLSSGVIILFSVAWYRLCLIAEQFPSVGAAYRWKGRHGAFLVATLKVTLMIVPAILIVGTLVAAISGQGDSPERAVSVALAPMGLVGAWLYARFSLMFPAVSIDRKPTLGEGWELSKGNGLSLLAIIILAALPGFIATQLLFQLKILLGVESMSLGLLFSLAIQFCNFVVLASGVTALALAYDRLSRKLPARVSIDV